MTKNDFLINTLEHSWDKSPKQKAREKEYNAEYYRKNKEKWQKDRQTQSENTKDLQKTLESVKNRYDQASGRYNDAKNKYESLRQSYQLFLEGAKKVGQNDAEIVAKRSKYQKDLESAANDLANAEKDFENAKNDYSIQRTRVHTSAQMEKQLAKKDPYRGRSVSRANANAENERARLAKSANTKQSRIAKRASSYAENEKAKLDASKARSVEQKKKVAEKVKKINDDIFVAKQRQTDIKANMDETTKMLKKLNKGSNKSGAQRLAKQLVDQKSKLDAVNTKISDLQSELKRYT